MISKEQFLESILKELKIIRHLYGKLTPNSLNYRPTPQQRSTLELLQYISYFAGLETAGIHQGGIKNFQEGMKAAYTMPAENFLEELNKQEQLIKQTFNELNEAELKEEIDLFGRGRKQSKALWLMDLVLKGLVGYKMQLFLYLKACGAKDLGTANLWRGEDVKK